jgi:hypothetical protein
MVEMSALRQPEIKELIQNSYRLVLEKLPRKKQAELSAKAPAKPRTTKRTPAPKRRK